MKSKILLIICAFLAWEIFFLISGVYGFPKAAQKAEYVPGELIVKFKPQVELRKPRKSEFGIKVRMDSQEEFQTTTSPSINALMKKHEARELRKLFREIKKPTDFRPHVQAIKNKFPLRVRRAPKDAVVPDISNVYRIKVPEGADVQALIEEYRSDPNVEYAEPNYKRKIFAVPNDPYYSSSGSWGQSYKDMWGLYKIQAVESWDISTGSSNVVVAVTDTGVDYNHEDISANIWSNAGEIPGNGVDDDGNGYIDDVKGWDFAYDDSDPMDGYGHGTHVAGTIAAKGNNGIGVVGVSWNSKVMAVKGLSDYGYGSDSDLANAIVYAADNGADVINMSWGGKGISQTITDAVDYAHGFGCVLVAAAGNDNDDVMNYLPANLQNVITVASSNSDDAKSDFSNWGSKIDVAAPGGNDVLDFNNPDLNHAYTVLSLKSAILTPYMQDFIVGGSYLRSAGTSMAAPHVAGLAALILSKTPSFTQEEVRQIIRTASDDLGAQGWDQYFGYGRINAYKALQVSSSGIMSYISSPEGNEVLQNAVEIKGRASGSKFQSYKVEYGLGSNPSSWTQLVSSTNQVNDGTLCSWNTKLVDSGAYTIRLTVFSIDGGSSEFRTGVDVSNPVISVNSGPWSDVGTWQDGRVPGAYDSVKISSGHEVYFDRNDGSTTCRSITINSGGKLIFDSTPGNPKTMQVKGDINVYGTLELVPGSTLKLECDTNGQYGIIVYSGGELKGTGSVPTVLTTLAAPLNIGGQAINVANASGFGVGDIITLGEGTNAEGFTISSISGNQITLNRKALNAQNAGAEVYKNATVTTSNISAGSKTFTVADLGGIKAGDRIVVAATSMDSYWETHAEIRTVESVSLDSITVTQDFSYSHLSGAVVVKINRNTLITSSLQDSEHNGYLLINSGGFLDLKYFENSYFGNYSESSHFDDLAVENDSGIYVSSSNQIIVGCSIHDANYYGLTFSESANNSLVISNIFFSCKTGIFLESKNNMVVSNVFLGNIPHGLVSANWNEIDGFVYNYFLSNYALSNRDGFFIRGGRNVFLYNSAVSNGYDGIVFSTSKPNIIFGNTSLGNVTGIMLNNAVSENILVSKICSNNYGINFAVYVDNPMKFAFTGIIKENSNLAWNSQPNAKIQIELKSCQIDQHFADNFFTMPKSFVIEQNPNGQKGYTKISGDYHSSSIAENQRFNYVDQSYPSSATAPILFRGSNHTITTPETSDSTTTTEVWFVTYRSATSNWEVKGTVSGLQTNRATSGVLYTSDSGQVKFTITQNSPQEGDQFVFATIAAAGDANTQKKILFGPSAIAELNNQSRLVVDQGGKIELKGTADYPTLIDYDGTGGYGFVISGEVDAQYFDFNQINSSGVKIDPNATITRFDNGSIRNVSGLGPHLSVNGKDHTFNYVNFDSTGAYDVKAVNDADLTFVRSQRGKFSDSIADTSSVSWDDPILGYTNNYVVGPVSYNSDSKILTVPFKIKDLNSLNCTFKSSSFQYSQNGGKTWRTVSDSDLSGISGSFASAIDFGSAPEHKIYWNTGQNYNNLEANLAVRFRVNNGYVYGNYGSSEAVPFNLVPPIVKVLYPNGGESINAEKTVTMSWNATDEGSGIADNSISLYYSTGEAWQLIANNLPNTGSYLWTPPMGNYSNVRIRVTATDNVGLTAEDASDSAFVLYLQPPVVRVIYPNGSESICAEKKVTITWDATDEGSGIADNSIALYYSTGEAWQLIATGLPNTGNYSWNPPRGNYNNVRVKVTASDNVGLSAEDVSDNSFALYLSPPTVQVLSPNGGELLKGGATAAIKWAATDEGSGIADNSIDIYYNDGTQEVLIVENKANTGSYSWTTPKIDSENLKVKVTTYDNVGEKGEDASDAFFAVDSTPPAKPTVNPVKSPTVILTQTLGGTKPADAEYILVNGSTSEVSYPSSTAWNCTVQLKKGENQFRILTRDRAGNESEDSMVVILVQDIILSDSNGNKLTIPEGAISKEANFELKSISPPKYPLRGAVMASDAIDISSEVSTFNIPVLITLKLKGSFANPRPFYYDAGTGKWSAKGLEIVSVKSDLLTFKTLHLSTFAVFDVIDTQAPTVSNFKVNNLTVAHNDSISDCPEVSVDISDDFGIDTGALALTIDGQSAQALQAPDIQAEGSAAVRSGTFRYKEKEPLPLGEHTFVIVASDEVGNSSSLTKTLYVVGSSVSGLMVYPNPYRAGETLKFDGLSGDVHVYIYDAAGDLVWKGLTSGAASISWDGKNHAGNAVAPGVYFYVVKDINKGEKSIGKIAVIK